MKIRVTSRMVPIEPGQSAVLEIEEMAYVQSVVRGNARSVEVLTVECIDEDEEVE